MTRSEIIADVLTSPDNAVKRRLMTELRRLNPDSVVYETSDLFDSLRRYREAGRCTFRTIDSFDADYLLGVHMGRITTCPVTTWNKVEWSGVEFEYIGITTRDGFSSSRSGFLVAPNRDLSFEFRLALDAFENSLEGAVLVFQDGDFRYDKELGEEIQSSTFDNLILPSNAIASIREDVQRWLDSKELYEKHGIPWKRGLIFVGPPGNGKTHLIKAIVNHFGLNTIYVRSFKQEYGTDTECITSVFRRARACAPVILILEDLDSLVDDANRSHFLNELDGFAKNTGILLLASANNPERLDPALVNRPSRFDRRYLFDLPGAAERTSYLQFFTSSLNPDLRLDLASAQALSASTEGFSFAYLKELVLSSMMAWISEGKSEPFIEVVQTSIPALKEQMSADPMPTPERPPENSSNSHFPRR